MPDSEKDYGIEICGASDLPEYKRVFEQSVGKTKPLSYFQYNHGDTPSGTPVRMKVVKNGEMVGSHTIRPLLISVDGNDVQAGLTMDSFIHPDHRKKGLFTKLVTATSREAANRGWKIILGFANRNSINIYKKRLGHVEPGRMQHVVLEKPESPGMPQQIIIEDHRLPESAKTILDNDLSSQEFRVFPIKDLPYIEWRYMRSPESRYQVLSHGESFFCMLKSYGNELQIVDFFYTDKRHLPRLLASCIEYAKKRGKSLSCWLSSEHPLWAYIKERRHRVSDAPQHLHVFAQRAEDAAVLNELTNWHYVMGDSDVF